MASRKLRVESTHVGPKQALAGIKLTDTSQVLIVFSRPLTPLEVQGVKSILTDGLK